MNEKKPSVERGRLGEPGNRPSWNFLLNTRLQLNVAEGVVPASIRRNGRISQVSPVILRAHRMMGSNKTLLFYVMQQQVINIRYTIKVISSSFLVNSSKL